MRYNILMEGFKRFFISLFLVIGLAGFTALWLGAYAQSNNTTTSVEQLPAPLLTTCDTRWGKWFPLEDMLVLPLYFDEQQGLNAFIYELMFVRGVSVVPFNYVVVGNSVKSLYCDKPDYYLGIKGMTSPMLVVVGTPTSLARADLQSIVDRYRIRKVYTGNLQLQKQGEAGVVLVKNLKECSLDFCKELNLYPQGVEQRPYAFKIEQVGYPNQVVNPSKVTITVKIKNLTNYVVPAKDRVPLTIREVSNNPIPQLYTEDWESLKIVKTVNTNLILPQSTVETQFTTGPFLKPATLESEFALFLGDREILNTRFKVRITFKKGDYKLGVIYSNEYTYANVRKGPSFNSEVLFKLDVGEYVIWLEQQGAWVKIRTVDGREGWVYRRLIREYISN